MTGGIPSCMLLLAALSSAAVTNETAKRDVDKALQKVDTPRATVLSDNKDSAPQESKALRSPTKRQRRKFDFDAEFASYLGLAPQDDTERYLAGDKDFSYGTPHGALQTSFDENPHKHLRLVPGSKPASFAYFTHIYPDKHSDDDIRVEHFSPIVHPLSSEWDKSRRRDEDDGEDGPQHHQRPKVNVYQSDVPFYAPAFSRSQFGRLSNKQRHSDSSGDGHKTRASKGEGYKTVKGFADRPDNKMGFKKLGMYHKFHEEDLHPKKTSSEWIPLKKYTKSRTKQNHDADTDAHDPEDYHDARVPSEGFLVGSEHDDVGRIKSNPPHSKANVNLNLKGRGTIYKVNEDDDKGDYAEKPFGPSQPQRRHKKKRRKHHRKHKRPHPHGRPAFRSSPETESSGAFYGSGKKSEYKTPSFEFRNPVNSYVTSPFSSSDAGENNSESEPFKNEPGTLEAHRELDPSEPFRVIPEDDPALSGEDDKDNSLEDQYDSSDKPADYGPSKLDDLDKDYHIISEAGPREHAEHTKDFDRRLPKPDGQLYGSFETFESQLDSSKKKFEPFVQHPFDEQRKELRTVVAKLIENGKSR